MAGGGHLRLRPRGRARRSARAASSPSTPRRRRPAAVLHMGHVFSYTHTDCMARYKRMAGLRGLLPDRLGRQRPARPRSGCRTTTACAATRPCPTTRASSRRHRGDAKQHQGGRRAPISRQNFIELCDELTVKDEEAFESLFRRLGLQPRLEHLLPHHRRPLARHRPAGVPAQPRARRGLPGRGPGPVGRHLPDRRGAGRARGPRLPGRLPPGRLPPARRPGAHRDHASRAHPELRGAHRPPRRRALPGPLRHDGHLAAVRCRGARGRAPRRRDRQGRRHRHVLHLR